MKVTGKKGLGDILKILLQICFYMGTIILIILPFVLQLFGLHLNASAIIIYPNGIVLLIIVHKFIELFDSLKNNKPFCKNNVKILKSAGKVAFVRSYSLDIRFSI